MVEGELADGRDTMVKKDLAETRGQLAAQQPPQPRLSTGTVGKDDEDDLGEGPEERDVELDEGPH